MSIEEPMSIEDRIRTATRAGASLVRDIGPMAADPETVRVRRLPARAARRWGTWAIPLAAAAAVALVAISLVAVRGADSGAPATRPVTPAAPITVPRYFVALDAAGTEVDGYTGTGRLIIGNDQAGTAIGTVAPPHGLKFAAVQGASDDRTFIVEATSAKQSAAGEGPETWYALRIAPGAAHPYQLNLLPIKLPGSSPDSIGVALSPDGRELAVESVGVQSGSRDTVTLALYSPWSGAELHAWTATRLTPGMASGTLSWLANGRQLAFTDVPPGAGRSEQLRTLDVTDSGTNLMTASDVVLTLKSPDASPANCYSMHLSPDGGTVVCGTQYAFVDGGPGTNAGCANGGLEFTAYSVRTGKPVRVLYQYRGACHNGISMVLWMNAAGTEIIGSIQTDIANEGGQHAGQVGVMSGGNIRPLKLPKSVPTDYYGIIAF
jgi:hypothetical protein